jgi:hypothetical protein
LGISKEQCSHISTLEAISFCHFIRNKEIHNFMVQTIPLTDNSYSVGQDTFCDLRFPWQFSIVVHLAFGGWV